MVKIFSTTPRPARSAARGPLRLGRLARRRLSPSQLRLVDLISHKFLHRWANQLDDPLIDGGRAHAARRGHARLQLAQRPGRGEGSLGILELCATAGRAARAAPGGALRGRCCPLWKGVAPRLLMKGLGSTIWYTAYMEARRTFA